MTYTEVFQDFLVITEDFRVSRVPEDLHGSRPDKIKYLNFIF